MESLDQLGLKALGFTESEAHGILLTFSSYLAQSGDLNDESRLKLIIRQTVEKMHKVLQLCEDLEYQKKTISPRVQRCLPLATCGTHWDPSYFADIRTSEQYKQFCNVVNTSVASDQNASLLHLIQSMYSLYLKDIAYLVVVSGTGKTHIAKQFVLDKGGILMSFREDCHMMFLDEAVKIITSEKNKLHFIDNSGVGDYAEEKSFTNLATDIIALIPLTFIEYAKYFYAEGMILLTEQSSTN